MGCVRHERASISPTAGSSQKRMQRARVAARQELEPVQAAFPQRGWDQAVGSSGTVRAIGDSIRELDPTAVDDQAPTASSADRAAQSSVEHIARAAAQPR